MAMQFTDPQLEDIEEYLEKYRPMECPVCSGSSWTTLPYPGAIVAQQEATVNVFNTLQIVQRVCDDCGYVVQFAASKLGVEQDADPPKKKRR
jgi:hypothetical protein